MVLIPDGFGQINWIFGGDAAPTGAQVTLAYEVPSGGGGPDDEAEFFFALWRDEVLPAQSSAITLEGVLVKHGPNATGPSGTFTGTEDGGASELAAPPNVALLVQKRTGFGGRTGRGRMFIPGIPEGQIDSSGNISEGVRADFETRLGELHAGMVVASAPPVLLHGSSGPLSLPFPITQLTVAGRTATQRQRLRR